MKTHKELHCSHFLVKLIYDPGRLVLNKLLTAFCEINLSLIKGLCGEGMGAGREGRGVVGRYECRISHLCMRACVLTCFSSVWLCDHMYCSGVGCHALLQGVFPTQGLNSGLLHCRWIFLPSEPPGKPKNTGVDRLSLLQGIFPTQGSNQGLLHCRQIIYQRNYQGRPVAHQWITNILSKILDKHNFSWELSQWQQRDFCWH